MADDRENAAPPAPPPPPDETGSWQSGGIYVRWRDQLWQEQPDGTYLLWDEATREWKRSTLQPPSETGQSVSTRECPNCGKRVKTTLRSCPYCEHGFERAPAKPVPSTVPVAPKKKTASLRDSRISGQALLLGVALVLALAAGLFLKVRSDSCDNWRAGVDSYTKVAIEAQGLPRGLTAEGFRDLNEERFADTRPGGCE